MLTGWRRHKIVHLIIVRLILVSASTTRRNRGTIHLTSLLLALRLYQLTLKRDTLNCLTLARALVRRHASTLAIGVFRLSTSMIVALRQFVSPRLQFVHHSLTTWLRALLASLSLRISQVCRARLLNSGHQVVLLTRFVKSK